LQARIPRNEDGTLACANSAMAGGTSSSSPTSAYSDAMARERWSAVYETSTLFLRIFVIRIEIIDVKTPVRDSCLFERFVVCHWTIFAKQPNRCMSDLAVKAEALISAVARAFYEDEAICLIDVLLRDKYLRDDDMGPRLSLQPKQLRRVLQFLQDEHMVKFEEVDDLAQGGSQQTKFWYIDYNQAVHTIRLRLYLLKQKLEQAELAARSSSFYLCPGYNTKRCNGRYSEEQAQTEVDPVTGLFLCQECVVAYESSADPPDKSTYTLQLVDNAQALKRAVDDMRRVHVQLSGKMIANEQLRPSIYDSLQKVRVKGKGPLTSNLPSENFSLGIGSKRLAGTGRTAGIKAKKRAQLNPPSHTTTSGARIEDSEIFLKNAMGQELQLLVEKGGGARAQLLATHRRRKRKWMDAAATRVGAALPVHVQLYLLESRKSAMEKQQQQLEANGKSPAGGLFFLQDNIGRGNSDKGRDQRVNYKEWNEDEEDEALEQHDTAMLRHGGSKVEGVVLMDDAMELLLNMDDEERKAAFQRQYKLEMTRQAKLLNLDGGGPPRLSDEDVLWEDA
jgi:transcription initiation factor IIE alpha subunit